ERMLRTLNMVLSARKESLSYMVIPTMFDRRTRASVMSLKTIRERYADYVWKWMIPVDTQFREASRLGAPLSYLNPHSRGVLAYSRLLDLLLKEMPANGGDEP
ncbi:MAG: ParA family protein, partial [Gammaproteobacteria bacterium]|nr:ParA family protein [Gammaproteobacteria bacterium]